MNIFHNLSPFTLGNSRINPHEVSAAGPDMPRNTPPQTADVAPAAPEKKFTEQQTREGLDKLKKEFAAPEKAGEMMKLFQEYKVDASKWQEDPKSAIPTLKKFFPEGPQKEILIAALNAPEDSKQFSIGKQTLLTIADNTATRRLEIEKARLALQDIDPNALNRNAKEGLSSIARGVLRSGTSDMIVFGLGALVLMNHIFNKNDKNKILRPLAFGALGFFGLNSLSVHLTDKSVVDHGSTLVNAVMKKFGMKGPNLWGLSGNQLPDQLKVVAHDARIEGSREVAAMGRLSKFSMKQIYSYYDPNKRSIDPHLLGFHTDEITGEELFRIVDAVVMKFDERRENRKRVGKNGDFKKEFVDKHDYTFLEATILLYEKDVDNVLDIHLNPAKREAWYAKVEHDAKGMFEGTNVKPEAHEDAVSLFGISFHAKLNADESTPDNPSYTYELGDKYHVTLKMEETNDIRSRQITEIKKAAHDFIIDSIKKSDPSSPALAARLEYDEADKVWKFKNVDLGGPHSDLEVVDPWVGDLRLERHILGKKVPFSTHKIAATSSKIVTS